MFAGYSHTLPVGEALRATFDPARPCEICRAVAKAKETEQKQAPQQVARSADKLLLTFQDPANPLFLKIPAAWPLAPAGFAPSRAEAVPVPPPRIGIA
jgi:hypothetical protein